ncbi:MAG: hypothetical protein KAG61_03940 [Bacteriovoracaceae bacterium]|nr:hypothetical protein [Bacteriovoracaceae bacterium]
MKWPLLIFIFVSVQAHSNDVIDLGSLEVEGEIRRPIIPYTNSKTVVLEMTDMAIISDVEGFMRDQKSHSRQDYFLSLSEKVEELNVSLSVSHASSRSTKSTLSLRVEDVEKELANGWD